MTQRLSKDEIKKRLDTYGFPYEHFENGTLSAWTFKNDETGCLRTGDGGAQMMVEALEKKLKGFNLGKEIMKKLHNGEKI